jgi:hypothetical protein
MRWKELVETIEQMDKKSDNFFELLVCEKYWDIDNPDSCIKSRRILKALADSDEEFDWLAEVLAMMANELIKLESGKTPAAHGSFGVGGKEYHFDFYTDKSALTNLEKMLRQTVLVKTGKENENQDTQNPVDA